MGPYLDWFVALLLTELSLHGFLLHFVGAELFTVRHRKFLCGLLLSRWVFWHFWRDSYRPQRLYWKHQFSSQSTHKACLRFCGNSTTKPPMETIFAAACFRVLFGDKPVIHTKKWIFTLWEFLWAFAVIGKFS